MGEGGVPGTELGEGEGEGDGDESGGLGGRSGGRMDEDGGGTGVIFAPLPSRVPFLCLTTFGPVYLVAIMPYLYVSLFV